MSSKEFKDFVIDQLKDLGNVICKPMMGEFLLYYDGILFGGIYDDRLLIKITNSNKEYYLSEEIPYKNAKPMYLVEELENAEYLNNLVKNTCDEIKKKKA